jgi:hypothetical protein
MKNWMGHRTILLFAATVLIAILNSCAPAKPPVDSKDLSYLYNPIKNPFNPRYNILNQSDNLSILSVKFFANDLFFSEANPQGIPTSQMLISAKLFNISQGKVLADTAVYNLSIVKERGKAEYVYNLPLKVENTRQAAPSGYTGICSI